MASATPSPLNGGAKSHDAGRCQGDDALVNYDSLLDLRFGCVDRSIGLLGELWRR
jgi:hypothetical protein